MSREHERHGWVCPECATIFSPDCMVCWLCSSSSPPSETQEKNERRVIDQLLNELKDDTFDYNSDLYDIEIHLDSSVIGERLINRIRPSP